jgi:ABC-2 type transport system permease protein
MRKVAEMVRASWMIARSYKLNLAFSIVALFFTTLPFYFAAHAMQPMMGKVIQQEGGDYFGFVLLGLIAISLLTTSLTGVYGAVSGSIGNGWLEAQLGTSTPLPVLLVGMSAYDFLWTLARVTILLLYGWSLGVQVHWSGAALGVPVLFLLCLAYFGLGLVLAAMYLAFRTIGPAQSLIVTGSVLLGGVYYPTSVIPSWIQSLSVVVPMTYGLRATRRLVLEGVPPSAVGADIGMIAAIAALLLVIGAAAFQLAFDYARRRGTLSQY